jgi:hypothetical protein
MNRISNLTLIGVVVDPLPFITYCNYVRHGSRQTPMQGQSSTPIHKLTCRMLFRVANGGVGHLSRFSKCLHLQDCITATAIKWHFHGNPDKLLMDESYRNSTLNQPKWS